MVPDELKQSYMKTIPTKVNELRMLIEAVSENLSKENLESLKFYVHKLKGNAGTYGFESVSDLCAKWEELLIEKVEQFGSSDTSWLNDLNSLQDGVEKGFNEGMAA